MYCKFRALLYIPLSFNGYENLLLYRTPYFGCSPFYAFDDGLNCPITWDLRGLI